MDLIALGMKLKADPLTYKQEYLEQLKSLEALITLSSPPAKQLRPVLSFVIRNAHIEPAKSIELLILGLAVLKDLRMRKSILDGLILARQRGLVPSQELFQHILRYGSDFRCYIRGCREFLDADCFDILVEWYRKGLDKQKSFCYFFLLVLFSRSTGSAQGLPPCPVPDDGRYDSASVDTASTGDESTASSDSGPDSRGLASDSVRPIRFADPQRLAELERIICEAFFGTGQLCKVSMLYFLNQTEVSFDISRLTNGHEYTKRIYDELSTVLMERELKIKKIRIFTIFRRQFYLRSSVINIILKMVDLEKEDLGELLDCLVSTVEPREASAVMKVLADEFVNEKKDEDVVCYGMNVMREIYYRLANIAKPKNICSNRLDEYSDYTEEDTTEPGETDGPGEGPSDGFARELREVIMGYIYMFKGNRSKAISFAYKALMRALVRREAIDRPMTFVMRSRTKEERAEKRQASREERERDRAKEHYEAKQKRNRRGRPNKQKNRLMLPSKGSRKK